MFISGLSVIISKGDLPAIISNIRTPSAHQSTLNPVNKQKQCLRTLSSQDLAYHLLALSPVCFMTFYQAICGFMPSDSKTYRLKKGAGNLYAYWLCPDTTLQICYHNRTIWITCNQKLKKTHQKTETMDCSVLAKSAG